MFFVKLLRFIKGYVRFTMTGGFVERFLNLCARRGVPLWDVEPTHEGMEAATLARQYRSLRPLAKKTGVRIRVKNKRGAYFVARRYRGRWGLAVGCAIFAIFLAGMSNFIWSIEVRGNERLPTEYILENLDALGVRSGVLRSSIDTRMAERSMLVRMNDLGWIAINLKGSTATVEVKERTLPPERVDDDKAPANIVAAETGQVKRMEVYVGQAMVKEGDTALKGDILVSGITEDSKGNNDLKRARAMILAEVQQEIEISVPLEQTVYQPTGKTTLRRTFGIFGVELPLYLPGEIPGRYNRYETKRQPEVLGIRLPITLGVQAYEHLGEERITYSPEEAKIMAEAELQVEEAQLFADATILQKEGRAEVRDNCLILQVEYTVERDIAQVREILTQTP